MTKPATHRYFAGADGTSIAVRIPARTPQEKMLFQIADQNAALRYVVERAKVVASTYKHTTNHEEWKPPLDALVGAVENNDV